MQILVILNLTFCLGFVCIIVFYLSQEKNFTLVKQEEDIKLEDLYCVLPNDPSVKTITDPDKTKILVLIKKFGRNFLAFWICLVLLYITMLISLCKNPQDTPVAKLSVSLMQFVKEDEAENKTQPKTFTDSSSFAVVWSPGRNSDSTFLNNSARLLLDSLKNTKLLELLESRNKSKIWEIIRKPKTILSIFAYATNTFESIFILFCFSVLSYDGIAEDKKKKVKTEKKEEANEEEGLKKMPITRYLPWYAGAILVLLFPALLRTAFNDGRFYESRFYNYTIIFDAISGIINGVIFALLIARLDSTFIGLKRWKIVLLYCYSALQPFFLLFDLPEDVFGIAMGLRIAILVLALVFKIAFFWFIFIDVITGDRPSPLFKYLFFFPEQHYRVNSVLNNPYKIRVFHAHPHGFVFDIISSKEIVFTCENVWEEHKDCTKAIEKLRKEAHDEIYYNTPDEILGSHYLMFNQQSKNTTNEKDSLKTNKKKDIELPELRSHQPVKSSDHAEELKKEAMLYIPNCSVQLFRRFHKLSDSKEIN